MKAKYINPFTDFGFKKIFGEEASKPLLIDFLNALLPRPDKIVDLSFKNTEQLGRTDLNRKAVYDIYCENERGEKFIVELQKAKQNYFKERTVYYSTFPIQEQAEKGQWDFNLKAVYCIGILDFTFDDDEGEPGRSEVVHTIKLKNEHNRIFYDKLTYIYLEMPNFGLGETELRSRLDQWLYFIKHLEDFQSIPSIFKDAVFIQAFETAELANLNPRERDSYEYSLKVFRDLANTYDYAVQTARNEGLAQGIAEGREEGRAEEKLEMAKKLKQKGLSFSDIAGLTGLSEDKIAGL